MSNNNSNKGNLSDKDIALKVIDSFDNIDTSIMEPYLDENVLLLSNIQGLDDRFGINEVMHFFNDEFDGMRGGNYQPTMLAKNKENGNYAIALYDDTGTSIASVLDLIIRNGLISSISVSMIEDDDFDEFYESLEKD